MNVRSVQSLPGVKRVGVVRSSELPRGVALMGICGQTVPVTCEVKWLTLAGEAECGCRMEKSVGGYTARATLRFATATAMGECTDVAFVVEDVKGRQYLVGSLERPRVKVTVEQTLGQARGGGRSVWSYEATHTGVQTMVRCVAR